MNREDVKKLEDKAARVTICDNQVFIEIWTGKEWKTEYIYSIDSHDRVPYKAIVKIFQLIDLKFEFEPLLIG